MVALRQNRHRQAAPQQEHREGLRAPEVPKIRGGIPGSMSSVAGTAQLIPQLSRGAYPAHTPAQSRCLPSSGAGASQPTGPTRSAAGSSSIERVRRSQCYAACSGSEGRPRFGENALPLLAKISTVANDYHDSSRQNRVFNRMLSV